ncbi:MAG: tyrosine-type recombinase/integrase [Candidatus Cryosericum sp.]
MAGGIYTDQRCPLCGGPFKDDGRRGLVCPLHPKQRATSFKVKFSGITRRFRDYDRAQAFLGGLRHEKGPDAVRAFDPRDYQIKEKPLSFQILAAKWLAVKQQTVKPKSYRNLRNYLARAAAHWGDTNIKALGYGEIEDFLLAQEVAAKTRANIRSALHDFWSWLIDREVIGPADRPKFPKIPFELGWRRIVDQATQTAILAEVARIAPERVWLGIKWLCDYPAIRPGELLRLKEGDILKDQGVLVFSHPKEKKPKLVPLFDDDRARLQDLPLALPATPFFRHLVAGPGFRAGTPFGERTLYKWWKRACARLGIEGVDLYGGTRHSSIVAARRFLGYEDTKTLAGHSTNSAFERYFHRDLEYVRQVQSKWRGEVVALEGAKKKLP